MKAILFFLLLVSFIPTINANVYEKDPIKKTKSDAVQVTDELLAQEGDLGPASPTIKMDDTSKFLTKEPYGGDTWEFAEEVVEDENPWWERWFFWQEDEASDKE